MHFAACREDEDGEDSRPPESSVVIPLHPEKTLDRALVLRARLHEELAGLPRYSSQSWGLRDKGWTCGFLGVQWPTLAYL